MPDGLPDVPTEMLESIGDAVEGVEPSAAPAEPTNQEPAEATATPEGETQEEVATDAPDSFTKLDPNALPEEVRPFYQSMLSDYTRKTQEAAPWRKLGEELGISTPDDFRQAAELFSFLQGGEQNVRQFYDQLGQALGQAEPATPATEALAEDEFAGLDDPVVQQLKAELQSVKDAISQRDEQAQREALQWALLGEMNRQQALVSEQHPDWGSPDSEDISDEWRAVWSLAPTFNGDVVQAAAVVEAVQNAGVTRLLNGKAQAASTEGLTPPAPARLAQPAPEGWDPNDLELKGPTQQAIEFLRGVVNQSE